MFHSVNTKIIAAFVGVLAVALVAAFLFGFNLIRQREVSLSESMGLAAAKECAAVVALSSEGNSPDKFVPGTDDYEYCRDILRSICRGNGMSYLYVYECDIENDTVTYIIAVGASEKEEEMVASERPYGTVVRAPIDDIEKRVLGGEEVRKPIENNNQFGQMFDWYWPVYSMGDNVLAGASYSVSQQQARVVSGCLGVFIPFVVGLFCLLIVLIAIMRRNVFKPLQVIAGRMRGFSADASGAFEPLGIKSKDEIGDIAEAFEGMADAIETYASNIERMTSERVHDQVELDVARRIQRGMVPERTDMSGTGFSACGFSRPARSVGGDFYDIVKLEDGRIACVVGDTSGKGVAAALFMAMAKPLVHDSLMAGAGPADVLLRANARFEESNPEGMFISAFACILDPSTGEVRFANAGHMPPLLVGDDARAIEVDPGDLLGLYDDASIEEGLVFLERGEGLLVYTDGAVEAVGADGSFFGEERLIDSLREKAPFAHAGELVDTAVSSVGRFVGDCEQFDDLTLVAIMREGEPASVAGSEAGVASGAEGGLELDGGLPCEMASFAEVRGAIFATAFDDALKRTACLACEEAFANIVSYSGATRVWAEVSEEAGALRIMFADDGIPFDPVSSAPVEKDFDDLDSGGMGIALVRQLASSLEYRRDANRNILTIAVSQNV